MSTHSCHISSLILLLSFAHAGPALGQEATPAATTDTEKSAQAPPDSSRQEFDADQILGTWKYVSGEKNGLDLNEDHFTGQEVVITKDAITLKSTALTFVIDYEFVENTLPQAVKMTIRKSPF